MFDRMFTDSIDKAHLPEDVPWDGSTVPEEAVLSGRDACSSTSDTLVQRATTNPEIIETQLERLVRERKERLNA